MNRTERDGFDILFNKLHGIYVAVRMAAIVGHAIS